MKSSSNVATLIDGQVCAGRQREMPVIEVQTSVATHFEAHRCDGASAGGRRLLRYRSVARP